MFAFCEESSGEKAAHWVLLFAEFSPSPHVPIKKIEDQNKNKKYLL